MYSLMPLLEMIGIAQNRRRTQIKPQLHMFTFLVSRYELATANQWGGGRYLRSIRYQDFHLKLHDMMMMCRLIV